MAQEVLISAIENVKQDSILETNLEEIREIKINVLNQLYISNAKKIDFHKKLNTYRFIDEISDLNPGNYIRWINLNDPNDIKITTGGYICEIEINKDGINIKIKTHNNRYIQIKLDEVFLFQKLTDDELIVLSALKYIKS